MIPRRTFGRTNLVTTVLGLGCAALGDLFEHLPEAQAAAVISAALESGITYFDTAPFYGHGLSEHRLGHALRQLTRAQRDELKLSTKVGRLYRRPTNRMAFTTGIWAGGLEFDFRFDYSGDGFLRSYEDSLFRLGLNRVNCLVIHDLDRRFHADDELQRHQWEMETSGWMALDELRRCGEVDALGVGINELSLMSYFMERFDIDFFLVSMPYTLLDPSPGLAEFNDCERRGISIVKGSPFASGILATGPVAGAKYDYAPATEAVLERTRRLCHVCERFQVPLPAAALQFSLAHPAVTTVIPGAASAAMIAKNVGHLNEPIPNAFWAELKSQGLLSADVPVPTGT